MSENTQTIDSRQESGPAVDSSGQQQKQIKSRKGKKSLTKVNVLTRFTSCGRCSLFLAAYCLDKDDQVLESAIENSDGEWLPLPWDKATPPLIAISYGCRLDADVYFFEGSCPECLGKFRYAETESNEPTFLLFKI